MKTKYILLLSLCCAFIMCGSDEDPQVIDPQDPNATNVDWLVDPNLVFDGGPGKDGIPSVDNPHFDDIDEIDFMNDEDLVLGIRIGDEIKAYPHPVLDWHEIVNDEIGDQKVALTYCPLTGTGIGWGREINGEETRFGVSGLLYNTNLMPFDRATESTWSQQRLDCVNGELQGFKPELYSFVETTWASWKAAYPNSKILSNRTGYSRNYGIYPYGSYRTNNSLLFPITIDDTRLPKKERVLGVIINEEPKAYRFDQENNDLVLIEDAINGQAITVVSHRDKNFIAAFEGHGFSLLADIDFPFIIQDSQGFQYDILGFTNDGSASLTKPDQFIGYWFSWGTFYEGIDIYE